MYFTITQTKRLPIRQRRVLNGRRGKKKKEKIKKKEGEGGRGRGDRTSFTVLVRVSIPAQTS